MIENRVRLAAWLCIPPAAVSTHEDAKSFPPYDLDRAPDVRCIEQLSRVN